MNRLSKDERAKIVAALCEGNSLRATARMCDVAFNTVLKLLPEIGAACSEHQDRVLRALRCQRVQCDEIWSLDYAKAKNVTPEILEHGYAGDVWTWTAMDADTKLVPSWRVGARDAHTAGEFIADLASRLASRVQLTTDGNRMYLNAIEDAFGADIDYAMLVKIYGYEAENDSHYSPAECIGAIPAVISGKPNLRHVPTSHVARQNLTMRMCMRRFTRLTNVFSKKLENHAAAVPLHYMHYNFGRIHKSPRATPAMEAGAADHVWTAGEIAGLLEGK